MLFLCAVCKPLISYVLYKRQALKLARLHHFLFRHSRTYIYLSTHHFRKSKVLSAMVGPPAHLLTNISDVIFGLA